MSTIATSIVHFPQGSFIGGGYNPDEQEAYFLTRPEFETVPLSTPDTETRIYRQICAQLTAMDGYPAKLNTVEHPQLIASQAGDLTGLFSRPS